MDIFVYRDGAGKVSEGFTPEQLPELLQDQKSVLWVDMESPSERDDRVLLDIFRFHPLTVEDCRANRHHPKIEEFPDYLYFIVHGVHTNTGPDRFDTIELDGYLGPNYVVTYHHDPFNSVDKVKRIVRSSPVTCQRGADFLLHQIIDLIVDDYLPVMDSFDERINKMEDDIFKRQRPNNQMLEQILGLKRSILRLRRISSKQLDVLYRISHGQFALISPATLPFYRDIYDHIGRVTDLAENYRDLISDALSAYLTVVSNRLNQIMKVLTIFSAIMLPLTFIAGVYGMNFDNMPELHTRYGYYVVWLVMISVTIFMLLYFRRKGWIGKEKE
jgi:magnesium transporter